MKKKATVISTSQYCSASVYDGRLRAVAEASLVESDWWVARVLVNPIEMRGKGIGGKLLERLKKAIKKRGGKSLLVTPGGYDNNKKRQRKFYYKHGFKNDKPVSGILVAEL